MRFVLSVLIVLVSGCVMLETKPTTSQEVMAQCLQKETKLVCEMRAFLVERYAEVTSFNSVIKTNTAAGVWSKAQAQEYLDASRKVRGALDEMKRLLDLGNISEAVGQRELALHLITELQRKIAAKARS